MIRTACALLSGGEVKFNQTPTRTTIGRVTLPAGVTSPWTLYAAPAANAIDGNWGTTPPMRAFVTLLNPGGSIEVAFNLGALGDIIALPSSSSIVVEVLPLSSFALAPGQAPVTARVAFGPGGPGCGRAMLTDPPVSMLPAGGSATFTRPTCAIGYRPYGPVLDWTTALPIGQYTAVATAVQADGSATTTFFGNANGGSLSREGWVPIHPSTNKVIAFNTDVVSRDLGIEWMIGLG